MQTIIRWPMETYDGMYLLYLLETPRVVRGEGQCSAELINPLNVTVSQTTRRSIACSLPLKSLSARGCAIVADHSFIYLYVVRLSAERDVSNSCGWISMKFSGRFFGQWFFLSILMAISRCTWVSRYQYVSILDIIGAKGDGDGGNNWTSCKAPVKMSPLTNQHQLFTGRMPFLSPNQQCQSTEGKFWTMTLMLINHSLGLN